MSGGSQTFSRQAFAARFPPIGIGEREPGDTSRLPYGRLDYSPLLKLARLTSANDILPCAFYMCSLLSMDELVRQAQPPPGKHVEACLSADDLVCFLRGREEILMRQSIANITLFRNATTSARCTSEDACTNAIDELVQHELERLGSQASTINILGTFFCSRLDDVYRRALLCPACRQAFMVQDNKNIMDLFNQLPTILNLDSPIMADETR